MEQGNGLGTVRVSAAFLKRGVRMGLAERVSSEQRYKAAGGVSRAAVPEGRASQAVGTGCAKALRLECAWQVSETAKRPV